MNLVERVKNILTTPAKEWQVISLENTKAPTLATTYLIPLALIGTIAAFVGYGVIGMSLGFGYKYKSIAFGIKMAIAYFVSTVAGAFILAFIADALAPNFGAEKNFDKSFQLAAYVATPGLIAGVFYILPSLVIIAGLAGLYGLYLLYLGLPILKKSPEDKKTTYFVVLLVVAIVVNFVLGMIIRNIMMPSASDILRGTL